jgi:DNA-binding PadR family transcriptional regulator
MHKGRYEDDCCGPRRGRWNFEGFGDFWGPGRGRNWRARAGRVFEQGDLKLVILRLLEEKPRHGYEIIKELESRLGGSYAPSPGTVYPTLTMLEDMGFARVVPEESGKKIYQITDEGKKHLAEHSSAVNDIFERIAEFVGGLVDTPMTELRHSFKKLARATYMAATSNIHDRELVTEVGQILERAATEIEALGKGAQQGKAP